MAENINISPDMINNLVDMLKNSSQNSEDTSNDVTFSNDINNDTNNSSNNFNENTNNSSLDFETIMKIKSIMEAMNNKNDPNSNLLYSLKPYLRKSRQAKLDQYINLLKITQITGILKKEKGDNQ